MRLLPGMAAALLALISAGCASEQTRYSTVRMTSKVSDIYQGAALQNLARVAANPGAMPGFAVLNGGTTSVTDSGSGTLTFAGAPRQYTSGTYGPLSAGREVQDNITFVPLTDPDRLKAMQAAFRIAAGQMFDEDEARKALSPYVPAGPDPLAAVPRGWLRIGCKRDVPRGAWLVEHFDKSYVWVMPDGVDGLGRFTFLILDIATLKTNSTGFAPARGNIANSILPPGVDRTNDAPAETRPRLDYFGSTPGLFLVPRP